MKGANTRSYSLRTVMEESVHLEWSVIDIIWIILWKFLDNMLGRRGPLTMLIAPCTRRSFSHESACQNYVVVEEQLKDVTCSECHWCAALSETFLKPPNFFKRICYMLQYIWPLSSFITPVLWAEDCSVHLVSLGLIPAVPYIHCCICNMSQYLIISVPKIKCVLYLWAYSLTCSCAATTMY
jgi:hypothetical protein